MYTVCMLEARLHCFFTETDGYTCPVCAFSESQVVPARARALDSSPFRVRATSRVSARAAPSQATSQNAEHIMSTRVVVRLIATNHDSTQPLHEIRVSPGTLLALGASCYSWLLLGDDVPCFASVEPTIDEGVAVVPEWMMRHAAVPNCVAVELAKHPALVASSSPVSAARAQLVPAVLSAVAEGSSDDDDNGHDDDGALGGASYDADSHTSERYASAAPFDAAAVRAAKRQLDGLPLAFGALCAVQRLQGVAVLRVAQVFGEGTSEESCSPSSSSSGSGRGFILHGGTQLAVRPPGDSRLGDSRLGDSRLGDSRLSDSRLGDSRLSDSRLGDSRRPSRPRAVDVTDPAVERVREELRSHAVALLARQPSATMARGAAPGAAPSAQAQAKAQAQAASTVSNSQSLLQAAAMGGSHALLCGPVGCGKLWTLRRVASQLRSSHGVRRVHVRVAALLGAAESSGLEGTLTAAFAKAERRTPCLVLVSELALLSPSGGAASAGISQHVSVAGGGEGGSEARVAASLLARMRLAPSGVLVIGCAAQPMALPPCLRSHGGFELTFELPAPSLELRRSLVGAWVEAAELPCHVDADDDVGADDVGSAESAIICPPPDLLDMVGRLTASYSVRDLQRLFAVVSLRASLRRAARRGNGNGVAALAPSNARFSADEWQVAMRLVPPEDEQGGGTAVPPSAASEGSHGSAADGSAADGSRGGGGGPAIDLWPHVGGYAALRARLERLLGLQLAHAARHEATTLGVLQPPSGALLYGPSGNGKSLLAAALGEACGWLTLTVKGSQLFGMYVGDTESAVRELFRKARERAPAIIVLDELDALGSSRGGLGGSAAGGGGGDGGGGGGSAVAQRALSTLLNEMDGVGVAGPAAVAASADGEQLARPPIFIIGCTNRPELVDGALLRPGRLEQLLFVPPPDAREREAVLHVHARRLPLEATVRRRALAEQAEGFSCAALAALCREAARLALARHVRGVNRRDGPPEGGAEGGAEGGEGGEGGESRDSSGSDDDDDDDEEEEPMAVEAHGGDGAVVVSQRDFDRAMRVTRCTHGVLSPDAHAEMVARFECFHISGGASLAPPA